LADEEGDDEALSAALRAWAQQRGAEDVVFSVQTATPAVQRCFDAVAAAYAATDGSDRRAKRARTPDLLVHGAHARLPAAPIAPQRGDVVWFPESVCERVRARPWLVLVVEGYSAVALPFRYSFETLLGRAGAALEEMVFLVEPSCLKTLLLADALEAGAAPLRRPARSDGAPPSLTPRACRLRNLASRIVTRRSMANACMYICWPACMYMLVIRWL